MSVDFALLEGGSRLDLESGSAVLLEVGGAIPGDYLLGEVPGRVLFEDATGAVLLSATGELDRYRLGDVVVLAFSPPSVPLSPPYAIVAGPRPSTAMVAIVQLWTGDGGATFRAEFPLGAPFGVGTFAVAATFDLAGGGATYRAAFDVVAGGDPAGSIIAIHAHEGFSGRSILVQTRGGLLLSGSEPWI